MWGLEASGPGQDCRPTPERLKAGSLPSLTARPLFSVKRSSHTLGLVRVGRWRVMRVKRRAQRPPSWRAGGRGRAVRPSWESGQDWSCLESDHCLLFLLLQEGSR